MVACVLIPLARCITHRIGWALGVACSTVYAVLRRFGLTVSTACIA